MTVIEALSHSSQRSATQFRIGFNPGIQLQTRQAPHNIIQVSPHVVPSVIKVSFQYLNELYRLH